MEKNIIFATRDIDGKRSELADLWKGLTEWVSTPVRLLARYYSSVLEREVTMNQTWHLIEVQTAFFAGIFPADISVVVRLLAFVWFVSAIVRCKNAL